jgi:hypothetical protein
MSCDNDQKERNERAETSEKNDATGSEQRGMDCACPCGACPEKAKWICLAGLAGALGLVAYRALRQASPASCGAR